MTITIPETKNLSTLVAYMRSRDNDHGTVSEVGLVDRKKVCPIIRTFLELKLTILL